jgi:NTE family protein
VSSSLAGRANPSHLRPDDDVMTHAACVLSGGGLLAAGWELGVLEGMRHAGVGIDRFERIIGTSAGAIAGAVAATGGSLEVLAPSGDRDRRLAAFIQGSDPEALGQLFEMLMAGGDPDPSRRAALGALALRSSVSEERFIEVVAEFVPDRPWPSPLVVTAVDADDGAFTTWGPEAGVGLVRAVAASTSLPGIFPPISVGGHRWMDGGLRSPTSADLAAGSDLVVIVAAPRRSERTDRQVAVETADIRAAGGAIVEVRPDDDASAAFGPDSMDGRRQPLVIEAGLRQGREVAREVIAHLA